MTMTVLHGLEPTSWWPRSNDDGVDDLLRRGLDWLERVVPYDLATILVVEGDQLVVRCARGRLASERVRGHKLLLASFPTVCEALETRRARAFTEDDHAHGDGDPFDGVLDLAPGHACMVVPLCAANTTIGVLTLDRERCEPYAQAVVTLAEVYGQVLALAIHNAHRGSNLARLHERDRQHVMLLETQLLGDVPRAFETSTDPAVRRTVSRAKQAALANTPILISGAEDSGKGRLARAIHGWSKRSAEPFVILDCREAVGDIDGAARFEHKLFGDAEAAGRFWLAHGGSLFLTNIDALPMPLQRKLEAAAASALAGGEWPDVRLIAGTTIDLEALVEAQCFSRELFDRLSVFRIAMQDEAASAGDGSSREYAVANAESENLSVIADSGRVKTLVEVQRDHIAAVLRVAGGRVYGASGAAAILGLKPSTLQSKMKKLGLSRDLEF
ncbi:MAG: sigma 54-interacting transcriptional regulator [Clostridia bacterium]|nr:sigma 54-interacting transcriptional regulator [Deltaproteobacteria bacterium]